MKISVTMKDPEALYDAIDSAVKDYKNALIEDKALPEEEATIAAFAASTSAYVFCREFFKFGEYITIVFDTDLKTATVKKP